jgi:hypothetical protein
MSDKTKKELADKYKTRKIVGGVYVVRNTVGDKSLVECAVDLQGGKNRFEFSKNTGSCVEPRIQDDWNEFGAKSFSFEILEEISKDNNRTDAEFKADLLLLKEIWTEKLLKDGKALY